MMDKIMEEPSTNQCKLLKSWRKQNLLSVSRVMAISGIKRDAIVSFESGHYSALTKNEIKTIMYLGTHDRHELKRRWPLKKSAIKKYKLCKNPSFFGVEYNVDPKNFPNQREGTTQDR